MNAYPDYDAPFEIYAKTSDYQLQAAIIQKGRPVAYWSRSLQPTQMKYKTTEKELLSIILCLKEYGKILYSARIKLFTNHKNLTFRTNSVARIMRWRQTMEDYDIKLRYLPGDRNVLADCFSRLPRMTKITISEKEIKMIRKEKGHVINWETIKVPKTIVDIFLTETDPAVMQSDLWHPREEDTRTHNIGDETFFHDEALNECL